MFDWYYGRNRTPTYRDPRDMAVEVGAVVIGTVLGFASLVVIGGLWLGGVI